MPLISAQSIGKRFGAQAALTGVSFDVDAGEWVVISGPAESGRTTLVQIVATLIPPSSGALLFDGMNATVELAAVRRGIAFAGDEVPAGNGMRVSEYLRFVHRVRGRRQEPGVLPRVRHALALASVDEAAHIERLNASRRSAVALAAALLAQPRLLVVDERVELTEVSRAAFHRCVAEAVKQGTAVMMGTSARVPGAAVTREMVLRDGHLVSDTGARSTVARSAT
jgi:ABC-type multidrug transport system ATPase subunit